MGNTTATLEIYQKGCTEWLMLLTYFELYTSRCTRNAKKKNSKWRENFFLKINQLNKKIWTPSLNNNLIMAKNVGTYHSKNNWIHWDFFFFSYRTLQGRAKFYSHAQFSFSSLYPQERGTAINTDNCLTNFIFYCWTRIWATECTRLWENELISLSRTCARN